MFRRQFLGPAMVAAVFIALVSLLPLFTASEISGDEGYELTKGFLLSKGFRLYKEIWSDQPPGLSLLLAGAFHVVGPKIWIARLIAACFGALLFASFYRLVSTLTGNRAAAYATFFLMASPLVFLLSTAVMQEVPAVGLGLISALFLFEWVKRPSWGALACSALAEGLALEIKLTAAIMIPALFAVIWTAQLPKSPTQGTRYSAIMFWLLATGLVFLSVATFLAPGGFQQNFQSQFGSRPGPAFERQSDYTFPFRIFIDHIECTLGAIIGSFLVIRQKNFRKLVFPFTLLVTSLTANILHQPWWIYYYLYVAIPLAWLTGLALDHMLIAASKTISSKPLNLQSQKTIVAVSLCGLSALAIARSERRFESCFNTVRRSPRIEKDPIIKEMKRYAAQTHWVYAKREIYAFHAQLPVPPELAVVSLKRYWSGQISEESIVDLCERYKPELVVLPEFRIGNQWDTFLESEYSQTCRYSNNVLFVSKKLLNR